MKKIIKLTTLTATVLPILALAQARFINPNTQAAPVRTFSDVIRVLNTFIGWAQAILFVLAVIFILFAAFIYITSGGDPGKLTTARNYLIYAAVGIGVALLAFAVEPIVRQLLG